MKEPTWMEARRYDPRPHPHMNLARACVKQGRVQEAVTEPRHVLEIEHSDVAARREFHHLLALLN